MSTIKITRLSQHEKYMLSLVDEVSFAGRLHITIETIRLWRRAGLPCVIIGKERYYSGTDVWEWLNSSYRGSEVKNSDRLWAITPRNLLPRSVAIKEDLDESIPAGKYFIIPIE